MGLPAGSTLPSSKNFDILTRHDPVLFRVAVQAERYFYEDPITCLMKLRQFGELLAQEVATRTSLRAFEEETQAQLLNRLRHEAGYPGNIIDLFHYLRMRGNDASHHHKGDHATALAGLKVAWQLTLWFHRAFKDRSFKSGPFEPPRQPPDAVGPLRQELERLRAEHAAALSEAEAAKEAAAAAEAARRSAEERAAAEAADRAFWEAFAVETEERLVAAAAQPVLHLMEKRTLEEAGKEEASRAHLVAAATKAAEKLDLDEQTVRSLIDAKLRARGWNADTPTLRHPAGVRPIAGQNLAIAEWPTENGPADYALFMGLVCVGIVEAKRSRKNVVAAVDQAGRYSQGFLAEPGVALVPGGPWPAQTGKHREPPYRIPFLFATNGRDYLKQIETQSGIWRRDARDPTNARHAIADWPTPDGIRAMLDTDRPTAQAALASMPFDFAFGLRDYQMRAIQAVEAALADDQRRTLLLAMATGTGKTKLAVALLYRLLHTKRFHRVCFVVDRTALGDQARDAFATTRIVSARTFADIFGLKALGDTTPELDTKVHICTIQGLVKRVLATAPEDVPPVDQYDLLLVDECHRGYTLDREMSDAELGFRSEADYISKYRRVLEHFDAVRIGLTATPALHTTEIFGRPIFTYGLREAVIDGWLVDQEPPIRIQTELSRDGIHWKAGEQLPLLDPLTNKIDLTVTPDDVGFEVDSFNRRVVTEAFTRVVCEQLAEHIDPAEPGKTLIFAASDGHADMVVKLLGEAFAARHGAQDEALIRKITGSIDRPGAMIRRYRNDPLPRVAVTVDLLTTGIDVPSIVNLVFLRRVNSRILYDQMIGRATRLCPEIGKESFRVFDAVRQYDAIQAFTEMKPVVADPSLTFTQLLDELARVTDAEQQALIRDQLLVRLRQRIKRLKSEAVEQFTAAAGETPAETLKRVQAAELGELTAWVAAHPGLGLILDWHPEAGRPLPLAVSFHPDAHVATTVGYGATGRPEDFLEAFSAFLRSNENHLAALSVVLRRPRDLTQAELRSLALALQEAGFSEAALRSAWRQAKNVDVAAKLIGFVRQAALGDALEPWAVRAQRAVEAIIRRGGLTPDQQKWLRRIGTQVAEIGVADPAALDQGQFRETAGGFARLDRVFGGRLAGLLGDINEAAWKDSA